MPSRVRLETLDARVGGLPEGVRGRVVAVLLLMVLVAAAWLWVAAPLLEWHEARAERIAMRATLARRMGQVAAELPDLKRLASVAAPGPAQVTVLAGTTDALAGATLQQTVQEIAAKTGAALSSTETLPAEQLGHYRRIGVRVALSAPWPVLVQFLDAATKSSPPMLVNDLDIQGSRGILQASAAGTFTASMVVFAFRIGTAPGGA